MTRNKKIFFIAFLIFLLAVIGITIDMARRTTAPWNKKKQIIRAWDGEVVGDSTQLDSLSKVKK